MSITAKIKQILIALMLGSMGSQAALAADTSTKTSATTETQTPIQALQWVQDPKAKNICSGYYQEAAVLLDYPIASPVGTSPIDINAKFSSWSLNDNAGELIGNVEVIEKGRHLKANKAMVYYNADTGDITRVLFNGKVSLREAGKFIAAEQAVLYPAENRATLENAIYRVTDTTENQGILNIWGTSVTAERESSGILHFTQATYTTCSPSNRVWQLEGSDVKINKKSGWASIKNAKLRFKNIPIFYFPYITFPIDNARKTGFLLPIYGYNQAGNSGTTGLDLSFPFYWNIAPNYDATITPRILTNRGGEISGLFRYLTKMSKGNISGSFLPNDKAFANFKASASSIFANTPNAGAYLNEIAHSNNNRYGFSLNNTSIFNENWSSNAYLNYVSDSYYFVDLGNDFNALNQDQLLNQFDLNYQNTHWNITGLLQAFQTLHPINQTYVSDQYARTPELDIKADYPNQAYGLRYTLSGQFVNFDQIRNFITGLPVITGNRWHLQPQISLPLHFLDNGFITPIVAIDATYYDLQNTGTYVPGLNLPTNFPNSANRILPIVSIDSGLYFQRNIKLMNTDYAQTLEPEIFYLYVPYKNQDNIPLFDTTKPPFSFAQLFVNNRFAGYDRLGDANQITTALTSRFLKSDTGEQKLRLSVGEIFYIQKQRICLNPNCVGDPNINDNMSPLVGEASYNISPNWSTTATLGWDIQQARVNNSDLNLHYETDKNHIFNIGYDFVRNGGIVMPAFQPVGPINEVNNNLKIFNTSLTWPLPLAENLSAVGAYQYDIANGRNQVLIGGLQYDSCCWAIRLVASHVYIGQDPSGSNQFDNAYYVQFSFKGFTNVGTANPSTLLQNAIEGYKDYF